jgi:hypothetical protein
MGKMVCIMEIDSEELKKQDGRIVPLKDKDGHIIGTATLTYVDGDLKMKGWCKKEEDLGHITAVIYKGTLSEFEVGATNS